MMKAIESRGAWRFFERSGRASVVAVGVLASTLCGASEVTMTEATIEATAVPAPAVGSRPASRSGTVHLSGSALDRRMALLAAELHLRADQQIEIKALLQGQREQVQRIWSDTSLPPALRVSRTQAVSERTAESIRALLDGEQRKSYIQPRQRESAVGAQGASVEAWTAPGASQ